MSVIASCGHILTKAEGKGNDIALKRVNREGEHLVEYTMVCNYCYNRYTSQTKLVLFTEREQEKWLASKSNIDKI